MHDSRCTTSENHEGSRRIVCGCRQVTEEEVVRAIAAFDLRTLNEVRQRTNAGSGCGCCRKRLAKYLAQQEPVESSGSTKNVP